MVKYGIPSTLLNYLSRKHLRLKVSEDGVSVTALASMQDTNDLIRINPTPGADAKTPVLDGHALAKGVPSRLNAGDSIVLLAGATQSTVGCGEELLYVLRTSVSSPSSSKSLNSADSTQEFAEDIAEPAQKRSSNGDDENDGSPEDVEVVATKKHKASADADASSSSSSSSSPLPPLPVLPRLLPFLPRRLPLRTKPMPDFWRTSRARFVWSS